MSILPRIGLSYLSRAFNLTQARISRAYSEDSERQFRAKNLFYITGAGIAIILLLLALFVFESSGYLDRRAKIVFGVLFIVVIAIFSWCIKLVLNGQLKLARLTVTSLTVSAVLMAITLTGGFPYSIASPAMMIAIVMCYCLYGARASFLTTVLMLCFLFTQWTFISAGYFSAPNFVSQASIEFNSVVVILSTTAVICSVLAIFDASNRQYIQRANASMRSKTNFLANTSHEIRTPMNGIIGLSEVMMRTTDLDADQKMYMEAIHQSGSALMTIINDILDYSRLEAGRVDIYNRPFNLFTLIHEIRTLMTINAAEKNVIVKLSYPENLPHKFIGDAGRIRQVLINLVANAVKFTENGSVEIQTFIKIDQSNADVMIKVKDTGIGIPKDKLNNIFERFTQAESGTTQKYGGTGLGLSISQKLVELMGGTIGVRSSVDQGSTFWFKLDLPLAEAPARIIENIRPSSNSQVIIVSRRAELLESYGNFLYAKGYRVFNTSDIWQLERWLDSLEPEAVPGSMVVLDEALPQETIAECCLSIQSKQAAIKVINVGSQEESPEDLISRMEKRKQPVN